MTYTRAMAIALASLLLTLGCSRDAETENAAGAKPVAVVAGTPISRDVWELYVKTRFNNRTPDQLEPAQRSEALEELIRMYAGSKQAEKDKLATGEAGARMDLMRHSTLADLLGQKYLEGKEATEDELKAEYEERVAALPKAEYHARHILVDEEAQARDLIAQLDKGASFEKLAAEHSKDSSADDGGDLGWFLPGQMVKPFSDAVQQLEKGKYTATPVQSEFGWHVIKLEDTRATTPPPYDAVKDRLGPLVLQKKFQAHLDEIVKGMKVERTP